MGNNLGETLLNEGFAAFDIENLDKEGILDKDVFEHIFTIPDALSRTNMIVKLQEKAKVMNVLRSFDKLLKAYQQDYVQRNKQQGSNIVKITNPPLEKLKCGKWNVDDFGVYKIEMDNMFNNKKVIACNHPVVPVERLINVDSGTEKIKLAFYKDNRWQYVVIDRSVVANKSNIVQLADRGIEVTSENSKDLVSYIADMVSLNIQEIPYSKSINRLGWTEEGFAPYIEGIKYDGDQTYQDIYNAINEKGSYEEWKKKCKEIRKQSKVAHILLASSFAAPLVRMLGINCFILHLWGGTGTGKTVGLMLAMSIWGNPDMRKTSKDFK